ncbi:hypothetical protein PM082_007301 [Marasmius tenuissimus]|nr:hypothetical protein PM082_007301 [Marasmius tenuissimus]
MLNVCSSNAGKFSKHLFCASTAATPLTSEYPSLARSSRHLQMSFIISAGRDPNRVSLRLQCTLSAPLRRQMSLDRNNLLAGSMQSRKISILSVTVEIRIDYWNPHN